MIEHIPNKVENAFFYFHSAGESSDEFQPFLKKMVHSLPNTYIWAGDGFISGAPLMEKNAHYGDSKENYWFMFPMQDASSQKSFIANSSAMGASLISAGSFMNYFVDQTAIRFNLPIEKIILSGFQHGSSLALAASMMRRKEPFKKVILFEPYLLEAYYLGKEIIGNETEVICIENKHIQERAYNWIGNNTTDEMIKFGLNVSSIVLERGEEKLDILMIDETIKIINEQ